MKLETLDLSGLECPIPAIRTKRKLRTMEVGSVLSVQCTDPMAAVDIPFLVSQLGHELLSHVDVDSLLVFEIKVSDARPKGHWPDA